VKPRVAVVVDRVVATYGAVSGLAFCYGQGSVLTGLTTSSDLDLVMVWTDRVPDRGERPVRGLAEAGTEPVQFDGAFGGLDSLRVEGWQVDVSHCPLAEFDRWLGSVRQGDGWQDVAWPQPLHAVAGFAYGTVLADPDGTGDRFRQSVESFPPLLGSKSRERLAADWSAARPDLVRCAERSDGWLLHQLAGEVLRVAYIAWFAAHHRYCPFPKHLRSWAERFSLDPALVELERRLWDETLAERLRRVSELVEGILATFPDRIP
jgi:hypothetical protein